MDPEGELINKPTYEENNDNSKQVANHPPELVEVVDNANEVIPDGGISSTKLKSCAQDTSTATSVMNSKCFDMDNSPKYE